MNSLQIIKHKFLLPSVLILGIAFLTGCHHKVDNSLSESPAQLEQDGRDLQRNGVLTLPEYQRTRSLQDKLLKSLSASLTAADVDWLLSLTQRKGTEVQTIRRLYLVTLVLGTGPLQNLPAPKRDAVFQVAAQDVSYESKSKTLAVFGCHLFGKLKDKRGVPSLKPLLSSQDMPVRDAARRTLDDLDRS